MSLLYIGQQLTIYVGIFLLITGIIGNGINILVFSTIRSYRTTPCSFYFLIGSIDNGLYIIINLSSRIVATGFGIDLTQTSMAWCKARNYLLGISTTTAFTCSCLPTIDQFLVTSQSAYLRSLSSLKWAHRIIFIAILTYALHAIPLVIYLDISPTIKACIDTNSTYAAYISIYVLITSCIIPIVIMLVFGYLTYRNIRLTRVLAEQHADRQLVAMTLIQIILVVICLIPYGSFQAYGIFTSSIKKDADRLVKESFATITINLLSYVYYVGNCYLFLISSSRFRRSMKNRILFWRRSNQVAPFQPTAMRRTTTKVRTTT